MLTDSAAHKRAEVRLSPGLRVILVRADLVLAGGRARPAAGRVGALPRLEPRAQRDPAAPPRLEHPPERRVLHLVPRRDAPRNRARAARLLLARLGAHRQGFGAQPARPLRVGALGGVLPDAQRLPALRRGGVAPPRATRRA